MTWFSAMRHPAVAMAAALDRIEAAIHGGHRAEALEWLGRLDAFATHTGIASEQARVAHCRALLAEGETARDLRGGADAARAIAAAVRTRPHRAGLRRVPAPGPPASRARTHLQAALDRFEQLNAHPWAERARLELRAAGRTARKRDPSTALQLTPQEIQVARLSRVAAHPRGRGAAVPEHAYGRLPPPQRVRKARHQLAHRAGPSSLGLTPERRYPSNLAILPATWNRLPPSVAGMTNQTKQARTTSTRARSIGAQATGASSTGATSVAFAAVIAAAAGAVAMGAVAIGALAIGRLKIGDAAVRRLRIGELEVDQLRVRRLQVLEQDNEG